MEQKTPNKFKKGDIYRTMVLTGTLAVLIYGFLTMSSLGFDWFEKGKYLLVIIVPILLYIALKDLFK